MSHIYIPVFARLILILASPPLLLFSALSWQNSWNKSNMVDVFASATVALLSAAGLFAGLFWAT